MDESLSADARKKIAYLRNIYFFHEMPDSALIKIHALCTEKTYEQGTVLFFEHMPGDKFFIILEGELEIWKRFGQPDEILLGISEAGQPVGEMALIDNQPRSATVRARTPTRVYVIQADDFNNLLLTENSICVILLQSVTMMVRRSNESHIADLDRQNRALAQAYTELKAAQDELVNRERLSVVGRFSSLILHDIRNPLSALKSRVELLRINYADQAYFEQAIEKINSDISRMELLTAEFLDYARGDVRLQMSICSLDALFERFRDIMSLKIENNDIALQIDNQIAKPVIIDEERILRVLINAGDNACKAMSTGGKLTVRSSMDDKYIHIDIIDTGAGMTPDILDKIFIPFYSASSGGVGLGMIIIKNIVDAHHGKVFVSSAPGAGTKVSISLPVLM